MKSRVPPTIVWWRQQARFLTATTRSLSVQSIPTIHHHVLVDDQQSHSQQFRHLHPLQQRLREDEEWQNDLAYCLSFSMDDSDFSRNVPQLFALLDTRMKDQLTLSENQLKHAPKTTPPKSVKKPVLTAADDAPLPRTLEDALRPSHRAIVITETKAPFRVVNVNRAWEDLCGYSYVESKDKTLGSLLRGPDTNQLAATALIAQLLRGEEAGAMLTNYTKSGRRFRNRLRAGPLYDTTIDDDSNHDDATPQYFVGILQEVHDGQ